MRVVFQSDRTGPVPVPGLMQLTTLRSRAGAAAMEEAVARKAMIVLERVMMAVLWRCIDMSAGAECLMVCCGRGGLTRRWGWPFISRQL
jgi:hypothetical protein